MGKKSKNPSKTSSPKENLTDNDLLQELQTNINTLSIQDAINAVNNAKETINKLKETQQAAADAVLNATKSYNNAKDKQKKAEVNNNKSTSNINNYGNEGYWEDRYSTKSTNKDGNDIYEWYMSFNELKDKLYKDIFISGLLPSNKNNIEFKNKILVTGCGNSTICEDLVNVGFDNVYGMDYSESVINNMKNRIKDNNNLLKCCNYFQADALNMKSEKTGSYNTIFDKGTLDAITSNDSGESGDNNDKGVLNAASYMREVWRLLTLGGKFIIVTTMPNDIFDTIAIEPIGGYVCSNWKDNNECKKIEMTTTAGGEIYYYAIMKVGTANLASEYKANKNKSNSNQDIMSGIQALLLEAADAKKQMDDALIEVGNSKLKAATAMKAMDETKAYKKVLGDKF
jgi:SAM-dependent methyltransferase